MNRNLLSFYRKVFIYIMIITLVGGGTLSGVVSSASVAQAEGINDPWLDQWLPTPGGNNENSPFMPQSQGMIGSGLDSIPQNTPVWGGSDHPSTPTSGSSLPEEPVLLPKGSVVVKEDDFILPSYGFPLTIQRLYQTERKDESSSFGYGWINPYDHYIQLFADFTITEFTADGSMNTYTFEKDDPNLLVDSYDGDSLIYYPLDQGSYESSNGSTLERISQNEYRIERPNGTTYTFKGYKAPWRSTPDPVGGKLIAVEDRHENNVHLSYNQQGNVTEIKASDGRNVTFTYEGDLIKTMSDPLGRVTTYDYDANQQLIRVTRSDGTSTAYTYDHEHRLETVTSADTGEKRFVYEEDRVIRYEHEGERIYAYSYGDQNNEVTRLEGEDTKTIFTYNDQDQIIQKVDPTGEEFIYEYTDGGQLTSIQSSRGHP